MSQVTISKTLKRTLLNRSFQNYLSNRFGRIGPLTEEQLYFKNVVQQEYDRRKQQLADATTVEDVEAVSVVF